MLELKNLLAKSSLEERQGLSNILTAENMSTKALVDAFEWQSSSLFGYLFSSPSYKDIVKQVADKIKADYKAYFTTEQIEVAIAQKVMETVWEKMTPDQRREMEKEWVRTAQQFDKGGEFAKAGGVFAALTAAQLSGFGVYLLATTTLGAITGVLGITLPFAVYTTMTSAIAVILGPVGWIGAGLFAIWALTGPNYKKLVPAVLYVCALRSGGHGMELAATLASNPSKGPYSCNVCGKDPGTNVINGKRYCNDCLPGRSTQRVLGVSYSCSVCGKDPGHIVINGKRYCNDCRPK